MRPTRRGHRSARSPFKSFSNVWPVIQNLFGGHTSAIMASPPVLPPMNKISLIGIWMETVLYGFNCIVFGLCLFVLFRKSRHSESKWMLASTSTLLFVLCTIHIAASLRQLLDVFIDAPEGVSSDWSILYWLSQSTPMGILKAFMYDTLVFIQDLVLIWRLYIVYGRDWKICLFPVLVELVHMGAAYAASIILTDPATTIYTPIVSHLGLTGWSLDISLNVSLTLAIAGRLWWMGRKVSFSSSGHLVPNRYMSVIYTVVESGGLFAAVTIIMLGLYLNGSPLAFTGMDISSQLAVLTPLLIVVRVGLGLTHGLPSAYEQYTQSLQTQSHITAPSYRPRGIEIAITHALKMDDLSKQFQTFTSNDAKV
ncbi:hypothetical protein BS17DRAFT_291450 [Gyrodon lividus]|nr:hypothetical protein BS17DRAFT_291450 [Gyrodon lividus]